MVDRPTGTSSVINQADPADGKALEAELKSWRITTQLKVQVFRIDKTRVDVDEIVLNLDVGGGVGSDVIPATIKADVAVDHIAFRCFRGAGHDTGEARVALAMGWLVEGDAGNRAFFLLFLEPAVGVVICPALQGASVDRYRRTTLNKDVVGYRIVAPAADDDGTEHAVEQVVVDVGGGEHVIEVDPHGEAAAEAMDIVEEIVANDVAPAGPVASAVNGAGVVGFVTDTVDFVGLDEHVVTTEPDGRMGKVMNEIVGCTVTDARQVYAWAVHAPPAPDAEDVVVDRSMVRGDERIAVAANHDNAAAAGLADVAADDANLPASCDPDSEITEIAQAATDQ